MKMSRNITVPRDRDPQESPRFGDYPEPRGYSCGDARLTELRAGTGS